jgi:cytochrome c556
MRYLVCLLVGLLVGAITATTAANILNRRDPYPKALMNVMKHELATASAAADRLQCEQDRYAMSKLAMMAGDIEIAMPAGEKPDRVFRQYVEKLSEAIYKAGDAPCPQRAEALTELKNACDDCHRDYR